MNAKQKSKELTKRINALYHEMFATSLPQRKPPISQILPWLFLGSYRDAKDIDNLNKLQIKYVLNLAQSTKRDADLYIPHNITYKGINADDRESYDMQQHFDETFDFILQAAKSDSCILVHCAHGVSRSATIVIAFLARYCKQHKQEENNNKETAMTEDINSLEDAVKFVFQRRNSVCPNMGFMKQLFQAYDTW